MRASPPGVALSQSATLIASAARRSSEPVRLRNAQGRSPRIRGFDPASTPASHRRGPRADRTRRESWKQSSDVSALLRTAVPPPHSLDSLDPDTIPVSVPAEKHPSRTGCRVETHRHRAAQSCFRDQNHISAGLPNLELQRDATHHHASAMMRAGEKTVATRPRSCPSASPCRARKSRITITSSYLSTMRPVRKSLSAFTTPRNDVAWADTVCAPQARRRCVRRKVLIHSTRSGANTRTWRFGIEEADTEQPLAMILTCTQFAARPAPSCGGWTPDKPVDDPNECDRLHRL